MVAARRLLKAFALATAIYSLLAFLYISARIIINQVNVYTPFIDGVPFFTILITALITIAIAIVCSVLYLSLGGHVRG